MHSVKFSVSFMKNSVERELFYYCYKLLNWSLCSLLISSALLPDSNFLDFIMFKMHQISQSRILQNTSLLCERGISHNEFYALLNKHQNFITGCFVSFHTQLGYKVQIFSEGQKNFKILLTLRLNLLSKQIKLAYCFTFMWHSQNIWTLKQKVWLIRYDYNCTNETKSNCDYKNDIY